MHPWLKEHTILEVKTGSKAYGTDIETSDTDLKGVCIPPVEYFFGLKNFKSYQSIDTHRPNTKEDVDLTIYSLKKFAESALKGNPSILEMLFVREEDVVSSTNEGKMLLSNRNLFLSNRIKNSMGGYAKQQTLKMMNGQGSRHDLMKTHGYDTKFAMHALRLYQVGINCFETGTMSTHSKNADWLKEVRLGKYTKEEVIGFLEEHEDRFQLAYAQSVLPKNPDEAAVERLMIGLTSEFLGKKGAFK